MKRIKQACLMQTVHFMLKDGYPSEYAKREVQQEYEKYIAQLEKSKTQYKITEKNIENDGSIIIKIIKQYNNHDISDYLK